MELLEHDVPNDPILLLLPLPLLLLILLLPPFPPTKLSARLPLLAPNNLAAADRTPLPVLKPEGGAVGVDGAGLSLIIARVTC